MNKFLRIAIAIIIAMAFVPTAQAAGTDGALTCIVGTFVAPNGVTFETGGYAVIGDSTVLSKSQLLNLPTCAAPLFGNNGNFHMPIWLAENVVTVPVDIMECTTGGAYRFKEMVPAKNFSYKFVQKDFLPASDKIVRQYCG